MVLPLLIVPPETASASFSFTDIAEGTGIQIYFATIGETSGGNTYHLLGNAVTSKNDGADKILQAATDVDFDTSPFNLPRTVKGTAYLSGSFNQDAGNNVSCTATIKKYDGSTETTIGATITSQTEESAGAERGILLPIPLTETIIKQGELLRLTVTVTSAGGQSGVHADPLGSSGQPLKLLMPFKLDL